MSSFNKDSLIICGMFVMIAGVIAGTYLYSSAQNRATYLECLKTQERIAALSTDRYVSTGYCSRY